MPPVVSGSNPPIKDEVAKITQEWLDTIVYEVASAPRDTSPEELWTRHSHLLDHGIRLYKRLSHIAHPSTSIGGPSFSRAEGGVPCSTAQDIAGVIAFIRAARYSSFSERCLGMPSPSKTPIYSSKRPLHEMLFEPTDCFIELSQIRPANHGWLFVFREELEKWLLSTVNPFHVIYRDRDGQTIMYGIYQAVAFPEANMIGPEFAQLSDWTREIIATHISRSDRGTMRYNAIYSSLLSTHRTLRCILLQCVETPLARLNWKIAPRVSASTSEATPTQSNSSARNNLPLLPRSGRSVTSLKSDFLGQITRTNDSSERPGKASNTAAQCVLHQGRVESSHASPSPRPNNIAVGTRLAPDAAPRPSMLINGGQNRIHTTVNGSGVGTHVVPVPEPAQNGRNMGSRKYMQYSKTHTSKDCV